MSKHRERSLISSETRGLPSNIKGEWRAENFGGAYIHPRLAKTREYQRIFQESDGKVPIHLVLPRDRLAFNGTMLLCVVGLAYFAYVMKIMIFSENKKE